MKQMSKVLAVFLIAFLCAGAVILCADKNDAVVKYSLPKDNKTIMASQYKLYLPSEKELLKELKKIAPPPCPRS